MARINQSNWFSYHVFTELDRDHVLTNQVQNLLKTLNEKQLIDGFFYIRYNVMGRHLRLRFSGNPDSEKGIDRAVSEQFSSDDFRVEKTVYIPEVARYGGPETLPVAERYFQLSSEVCMAILEEHPTNILSRAVILHFAMAVASGKSQSKLIRLFESYTQAWISHGGFSASPSIEEASQAYFEPQYLNMKQGAFFKSLSTTFSSNESTGTPWLDRWYSGNKTLLSELGSLVDESTFFDVVQSLMHMTNNRLGIKNYEESFVAYLLKRTWEDECSTFQANNEMREF